MMTNNSKMKSIILFSMTIITIILVARLGTWVGASTTKAPVSHMLTAHSSYSLRSSAPNSFLDAPHLGLTTSTNQSLLIVLLDRSGSLVEGSLHTNPTAYSTSITKGLADLWPGPMVVIPFSSDIPIEHNIDFSNISGNRDYISVWQTGQNYRILVDASRGSVSSNTLQSMYADITPTAKTGGSSLNMLAQDMTLTLGTLQKGSGSLSTSWWTSCIVSRMDSQCPIDYGLANIQLSFPWWYFWDHGKLHVWNNIKATTLDDIAVVVNAWVDHLEIPSPVTYAAAQAYPVINTSETLPDGVWFRSTPHTWDADQVTGHGVYAGDRVQVFCYASRDTVGPYTNPTWYYVFNLTQPTIPMRNTLNVGWVNDHYINTGKLVISASADGTVQVWDTFDGSHLFIDQHHPESPYSLSWSPRDTQIASDNKNRTREVWNTFTRRTTYTYLIGDDTLREPAIQRALDPLYQIDILSGAFVIVITDGNPYHHPKSSSVAYAEQNLLIERVKFFVDSITWYSENSTKASNQQFLIEAYTGRAGVSKELTMKSQSSYPKHQMIVRRTSNENG